MDRERGTGPAGDTGLSRAQGVYNELRAGIREGRYRPGERIREETIARSLGVSRTPVREALSRLATHGLLELAAGGLVVASLSRPQVMELYAMREILEGSAARFAAQHAAPAELVTLKRLSRAFEERHGDPAALARRNRDFHAAIYEAAHNRYLMRMLDDLNDALALLPNTTFAIPGRSEMAVREHDAVVEAIERRDPEAAEALAREHIRQAQQARIRLLFEGD